MLSQKSKILDFEAVTGGKAGQSNVDYFYNFYINNFKPLRSPYIDVRKLVVKGDFKRLQDVIFNTYKIRSLEFGNWVNQVRRIDFLLSLIVALFDFNKVLKFTNNNIGVNKTLNIAFGARGVPSAFAHYEPGTKVINLSRDKRVDKYAEQQELYVNYVDDKKEYKKLAAQLREEASGYGSFAHEYGHFLDYIIAEKYIPKRAIALSGGRNRLYSYSNAKKAHDNFELSIGFNKFSSKIEMDVYNILCKLLFNVTYLKDKKTITKVSVTGYYKRLYDFAAKRGDYWIRFNEIWARLFEIFVAYKLNKIGIVNKFLVKEGKGKYRDELGNVFYRAVYPTFGEVQKLIPDFNKFLDNTNILINKR